MPAMPSNGNSPNVSRRDFLKLASKVMLALSGIIGLGGIVRFFKAPDGDARKTRFELGNADQYPLGSRRVVPEAQAIVLHAAEGFLALSTVCPHLGCQVDDEGEGFACPCHGSRFDAEGRISRGPAREDLEELRIEVDQEGRLVLYTADLVTQDRLH